MLNILGMLKPLIPSTRMGRQISKAGTDLEFPMLIDRRLMFGLRLDFKLLVASHGELWVHMITQKSKNHVR